MQISRRDFLKYCTASAAALGLDLSVLGKLEKALAAGGPNVIWLSGASCTGCTVSLANLFSPQAPTDVADLLVNHINLKFHPNLMGAAGYTAVENLKAATQEPFLMAVEGGIPTAFNGHTCMLWTEGDREVTALEAVTDISTNNNLLGILSIGTCASFGGVPSGNPNPTGVKSVSEITGKTTINIPGCPTHPDWIAWTIANLLAGQTPRLDSSGRPAALFSGEYLNVHKSCPRYEIDDGQSFAEEGRCLYKLGCKGERTQADCPSRKWNSGTNWCIGANTVCLGCTESGFPDRFSPFYTLDYAYDEKGGGGTSIAVQILAANWDNRRKQLVVEGTGQAGTVITVRNNDTGSILGTDDVGSNGGWRFAKSIRGRSPVPCTVRCENSSNTASYDIAAVSNAPGCGN